MILPVSTVGGMMGLKQSLRQLTTLTGGGRLAGKLGVVCSPVSMPLFENKVEKKVRKASAAFYRMLQKPGRPAPGVGDWMYFHSFKQFTTFASYRKEYPADAAYYQDKKEYFYKLQGMPIRRAMGKFFGGMMHISLKMLVKEPKSS